MKEIFLIASLPRSRTAWLATLLTFGDCFCYHDGLAGIEHLGELDERFEAVPARIVGNSDPANLLFHVELSARYPQAKWILVERKPEDALASFHKASGFVADGVDLARRMESLKKAGAWRIPFGKLDDLSELVRLTEFVGARMPPARYQELLRLNIQVKPELFRTITPEAVGKMQKLKASFSNERVLA